ncbi:MULTISPECIES: DUF1425 domain-containing protein [Tatumella]|uniref:YcfL family protein n=1 Tax=Tatumella punctata TaxID=399969 RepID=A0ABW1VLV2_9GAMM|nr:MULTISPECIES: DUF1425 domain-containing protein [unclassified Tatumella]MBS0856648.1 YcfL family protein [Tatumella sp. JGM16]MBS0877641.1 YcfL family protein [Tatumella sp. JGM82]MBS0891346.1 YcfL family protein [Tatumella sp. JGM94]MBS0894570.1 YcfL family protein [Tatumella sp. JGM130]MBS0902173.1 YcfL family protein [Tatumella sp. JGM100]
MRLAVLSIPLLLLLSACSSSQPQISISQPLVMESDVLSAGITTDGPVVRSDSGQQKATVILYNDRDVPVTLHYRYFWYDDKGLEILPEQTAETVVVPAHQSREAVSWSGNLSASQVRVSLYL